MHETCMWVSCRPLTSGVDNDQCCRLPVVGQEHARRPLQLCCNLGEGFHAHQEVWSRGCCETGACLPDLRPWADKCSGLHALLRPRGGATGQLPTLLCCWSGGRPLHSRVDGRDCSDDLTAEQKQISTFGICRHGHRGTHAFRVSSIIADPDITATS